MMRVAIPASALVLSAALIAACSGSSPRQDTVPATTGPATDTPTASATTLPASDVIDGVAVRPLVIGDVRPREPGTMYFFRFGKYAGDGGWPQVLWRYTTPSGSEWEGDLLANLPEGQPWSLVASEDYGVIAVANCLKSFCGGYGVPAADSEGELLVSEDRGSSWRNLGPLPRYSDLVGVIDGKVLVATSPEERKVDYTLHIYPGGEAVRREPNAYPLVAQDGGLAWRRDDGAMVDGTGAVTWRPTRGEYHRLLRLNSDGSTWETWQGTAADGQRRYLGRVGQAGELERVFSWDADIWFGLWAGDNLTGGNVYLAQPTASNPYGFLFPGMTVDLDAGVIHPIAGFDEPGRTAFLGNVAPGPFARVRGTGSCLNVREGASLSASAIACFADGTLLRLAGRAEKEWLEIETPPGTTAWAATEFLER